MSDRTSSKLGMRRPWMAIGLVVGPLGVLVVALAPNIPVVLLGWCIAQVFFNALLAAMVAVLPDQVSVVQRGQVSGVLGVCVPIASVSGTFVVKLFTGNQLTMFLAPCAIGGFFILLLAVTLKDRRLAKADKPSPAASTVSWSGWPSADSASACMRRRPRASCHVLPDKDNAAKDLGLFNIAGALPFSIAPAIAPAILAISSGSYGVLYAIAGLCAIIGAFAILPVKGVR